MQIKPSYLAIKSDGSVVRAENAIRQPWHSYRCHLCQCPVSVHPARVRKKAHFMHAQSEITPTCISVCMYLEEGAKARARLKPFRQLVEDAKLIRPVRSWQCVMCHIRFEGPKECPNCGKGIYCTEQSDDLNPHNTIP